MAKGDVVEFGVLGPVRLVRDGSVVPLHGRLSRGLLALLLARANTVVSADALLEALWGPEEHRVPKLQVLVHRLRKALEESDRLVSDSGGYLLRVDLGELDAERFESLLAEATASSDLVRRAGLLREAWGLWRGAPYQDVDLPVLAVAVQRLSECRLVAFEELAATEMACGRYATVAAELRELIAAYPLRERLRALLMTALYRAGQRADALAVFQQTRRTLVDELGLEPGSELRKIEQRILAGEPVELDRTGELIAPPPAQLPHHVPDFVGREAELAELDQLGAREESTRVAAITGMAGVGKTALAAYWAHRARDRFPDGQLYVDLRGFGPDRPLDPPEALAGFLRALGMDGSAIPQELAERSARFRTLVDGKRILIVLDNAADVEQIRPLLPGASSCFALTTSRDALGGLAAREGAHRLHLDHLTTDEAHTLLKSVLGSRGADRIAATQLIQRCAWLPLALRIAAERIRQRPDHDMAELVVELEDEHDRLDLLDTGDERTSMRTVFSWSYRHLPPETARLFRLLGLHPGHDIDLHAATALAGAGHPRTARRHLDTLTRAHLLHESAPGRYQQHDLLRTYAKELAETSPDAPESPDAISRLADHYLGTASTAMDLIAPHEADRRPRMRTPATGTPTLSTDDEARAWLDQERPNLLAVAMLDKPDTYVTLMSDMLWRYLEMGGYHDDALALHTRALATALHHDDHAAEANARRLLGTVHYYLGDFEQAAHHAEQALALYDETGDQPGRAAALNNLGVVHYQHGRYRQALHHFEQAIPLYRQAGAHALLANTLGNAGSLHRMLGHHDQALSCLEQALALAVEGGNPAGRGRPLCDLAGLHASMRRYDEALTYGNQALTVARAAGALAVEGEALNQLGTIHRQLGDHHQALKHLTAALDIATSTGNSYAQAEALNSLAQTHQALGDTHHAIQRHHQALDTATTTGISYEQARAHTGLGDAHTALNDHNQAHTHWQQALDIYRRLDVPEATEVQARLP